MTIPILTMFFATALANTGGLAGDPIWESEEHQALRRIEERVERGDEAAAIDIAQSFINKHSEDALNRQMGGNKKYRLIRLLYNSALWRRQSSPEGKAAVLVQALKKGPVTEIYERELLYLLAQTQTLEAMANHFLYSVVVQRHPGRLANSVYPPLIGNWSRLWRMMGFDTLLTSKGPVQSVELVAVVASWLNRFSHPDELVARVNKDSSRGTLEAIPFLLELRPDWKGQLSREKSQRLQYWRKSKGCDDALTGRES